MATNGKVREIARTISIGIIEGALKNEPILMVTDDMALENWLGGHAEGLTTIILKVLNGTVEETDAITEMAGVIDDLVRQRAILVRQREMGNK